MHSLANKKDTAESNMSTVIILYLISTFMAAVTAVVAGFIFPSEVTLTQVAEEAAAAPEGIVEVLQSMLMNIVDNPVNALVNANYLGVLAWAVILGLALRKASQHTVDLIGDVFRGAVDRHQMGHQFRAFLGSWVWCSSLYRRRD